MSDFVIGGLAARDFGNALVNTGYTTLIFFTGMAVAAAAASIAKVILNPRKSDSISPGFCYVFGIGVGLAGSGYVAMHLPFVTFTAEKALKFLAISLGTAAAGRLLGKAGVSIGTITIGGALGHFEPIIPSLIVGAAGSILGSLAVISSIPR